MASPRVSFDKFENVINGQTRGGSVTTHGVDPSTGSPLWEVPAATAAELDEAVEAGKKAFSAWSKTSWKYRQGKLTELKEALMSYQKEFVDLLLVEAGKPAPFADIEIQVSAGFFDFNANTELPSPVRQDDENLKIIERYVPIGVVGAICPWNFPLALAVGKIAAALVTGNVIIVKPSPFTPYTILKFAEIAQTILPPGVIQALNGDSDFGPLIVSHPGIPKISFTGSTATGKKIMASAAKYLKNVTLELGGNNATIICNDVDVSIVAPKVALGAFYNSGQLCVASKRIFVHEDVYDDFLKTFTATVESWKAGPASVEGTMVGPVQNKMQCAVVEGFHADCKANNYTYATGKEGRKSEDGYHFNIAVIDNPPDHAKIVVDEQFGPIVPLLKWNNEDELLTRVNNTLSGLGGSVWSSDDEKAYRIGQQIEAGTIWINSFEQPIPQGHFTGHKESGIGGEWGVHGLYSYCNVQSIHHYKAPVKA